MGYFEKESMTKKIDRPLRPRPITSKDRCNHKYKLIESETEKLYADDAHVKLKIVALFYCKKCLDIKSVVKQIGET